jgi:hypothetical protein
MKTNVLSFRVASTLLAYRVVAMNGTANTVGYPANAQALPVGVTIDTVKDTNQAIPVAGPGSIARLYFNDSVASGTLVQADSSGRGVALAHADTSTSSTLSAAYVGVLVDASVNSTATIANVFVMPGYIRGSV